METQNEKYMSEVATAEFTGFSRSKLQNDRWSNKGMNYIKVGRRVLYKKSDVVNYLEKHMVITNEDS